MQAHAAIVRDHIGKRSNRNPEQAGNLLAVNRLLNSARYVRPIRGDESALGFYVVGIGGGGRRTGRRRKGTRGARQPLTFKTQRRWNFPDFRVFFDPSRRDLILQSLMKMGLWKATEG